MTGDPSDDPSQERMLRDLAGMLQSMLDEAAGSHYYRMSLCYVVDCRYRIELELPRTASRMARWLQREFPHWPGYSGDSNYPVPSPELAGDPRAAYLDNNGTTGMWFGAYGDKRRDLAAFLVAQAKAELGE